MTSESRLFSRTDSEERTDDQVMLESIISPRIAFRSVAHSAMRSYPGPTTRAGMTDSDAGPSLGRQLIRPVAYFVASRVTVFLAALGATWIAPQLRLIRVLGTSWDGAWYEKIAQHGYPHGLYQEGLGSRWAFFPAFPAAERAVVEITRVSYADAAVALAFVFGLAAAVAIWLAVREVFGRTVADRTVLLFVFFPASYVLSMGYTEGLFLAAAGLCLFALARRYWMTAALSAGLASLTRNFGVILMVCVAVAGLAALRKRWEGRILGALVLTPLPFAGWLLYSWRMTGTPVAFITAEKFWPDGRFIGFLSPVASAAHLLTGLHAFHDGQAVLATAALVFIYIGSALLLRAKLEGVSIPTPWWIFTALAVLGAMSPASPTSVLRYSLAAFPLLAALAWKIRPSWEGLVVAPMAMAQGVLLVVVLVGSLHPNSSIIWP